MSLSCYRHNKKVYESLPIYLRTNTIYLNMPVPMSPVCFQAEMLRLVTFLSCELRFFICGSLFELDPEWFHREDLAGCQQFSQWQKWWVGHFRTRLLPVQEASFNLAVRWGLLGRFVGIVSCGEFLATEKNHAPTLAPSHCKASVRVKSLETFLLSLVKTIITWWWCYYWSWQSTWDKAVWQMQNILLQAPVIAAETMFS